MRLREPQWKEGSYSLSSPSKGLILGLSYPILDELSSRHRSTENPRGVEEQTDLVPNWSKVLVTISLFVVQYKLSAVLDAPLIGYPGAEDAVLLAFGLAVWKTLDGTTQGLFMSSLTAFAGPVVEITLINALGLYSYSHPVVSGVEEASRQFDSHLTWCRYTVCLHGSLGCISAEARPLVCWAGESGQR